VRRRRREDRYPKAGTPKAKLVPYQPPRKKRRFGQNRLGITTLPTISTSLSHPSCRSTSSRFVRLLIDTHILIWPDERPRLIVQPLRAAMRDETNELGVSAANIWEIAINRAIGKLGFDRPFVPTVLALGFGILAVTGSHAEHAGGLLRHQDDPFDRLIIAQAYLEGMVLGTQDRPMRPYGVATLGLCYSAQSPLQS
jgi:PIN domain nuclease of toxin-antitoxin system